MADARCGLFLIHVLYQVSHWIKQLCEELSERLHVDLDLNKRIAHTLTLHVRAYKVILSLFSLLEFLMYGYGA